MTTACHGLHCWFEEGRRHLENPVKQNNLQQGLTSENKKTPVGLRTRSDDRVLSFELNKLLILHIHINFHLVIFLVQFSATYTVC